MKTYFIIRDFFTDAALARTAAIVLKSYKIGGIETLTNDFCLDNISPGSNPTEFEYCTGSADGSEFTDTTPPGTGNSFNPWLSCRINFPFTNSVHRGKCAGAINGKDYGEGIKNLYVDLPEVVAANLVLTKGAFALDIDYTQSLYVEFDILSNYRDGQFYNDPAIYRTHKIVWNPQTCTKEFSYTSVKTGDKYQDDTYGFLTGEKGNPVIDFRDIPCGGTGTGCDDKERTRSFALFVDIPKPVANVDVIKECCHIANVLAQTTGKDYEKNDFTGFYHKRQVPGETATFVLVNLTDSSETVLNNGTFGVYKNFGDIEENPDLKTFVLSWQKVLQEIGSGSFTVVKRVNISGLQYEVSDINYTLNEYSTRRADKTIRIDVKANGYMERLGIDFKNSAFETAQRLGGFFGRREPKFEEDNIVYSNFVSTQISMRQTNEYMLQTNLLPSCITTQVFDFMLFANDIFLNDYNLNNHNRDYIKFPVKFGENKGTGYATTTTKAVLNLTFSEKKVDNIKRNY